MRMIEWLPCSQANSTFFTSADHTMAALGSVRTHIRPTARSEYCRTFR
jgi:hypothetical protein